MHRFKKKKRTEKEKGKKNNWHKAVDCICGLRPNRSHFTQNSLYQCFLTVICVSILSVNSPKIRKKRCKTCMKGPVEHQFQPDAKTRGGRNMLFPGTLGDFFCLINHARLLHWSLGWKVKICPKKCCGIGDEAFHAEIIFLQSVSSCVFSPSCLCLVCSPDFLAKLSISLSHFPTFVLLFQIPIWRGYCFWFFSPLFHLLLCPYIIHQLEVTGTSLSFSPSPELNTCRNRSLLLCVCVCNMH